MFGEPQDQADELGVEKGGVRDARDLAEGEGVDEGHEDGVAALGEGVGDEEALLLEDAHEGILALGGEAGEVHPGAALAAAQVVAVGLDGAEGDAAEAVDLEDALDAGVVGDEEDVALLADADAVADAVDGALAGVGVQGEVVEAAVGQAVAVVAGLLETRDEADLGEGADGVPHAVRAAAELGDALYQGRRDDFVVLAADLDLGALLVIFVACLLVCFTIGIEMEMRTGMGEGNGKGKGKGGLTAVRTRQSSVVRWRIALLSSFMAS